MVSQLNTAQREQTRGGEQILQAVEQLRELTRKQEEKFALLGKALDGIRVESSPARVARAPSRGTRRRFARRLVTMFGLGMGELIVILAIALIFLGPKRLPDVATTLGKAIRSFRKATRDLTDQLEIDDEVKAPLRELQSALRDEPPPPQPLATMQLAAAEADRGHPADAGGEADQPAAPSGTAAPPPIPSAKAPMPSAKPIDKKA